MQQSLQDFAVKFQLNIFVQNPGQGGRGKETKHNKKTDPIEKWTYILRCTKSHPNQNIQPIPSPLLPLYNNID